MMRACGAGSVPPPSPAASDPYRPGSPLSRVWREPITQNAYAAGKTGLGKAKRLSSTEIAETLPVSAPMSWLLPPPRHRLGRQKPLGLAYDLAIR
jgi:hypothetical protein